MSFFTAINCMDGRVQKPVIEYLTGRFGVDFIDTITEPGPVRILAEQMDPDLLRSIFRRVDVSIEKHASRGIAVVAHHDCAGNPYPASVQRDQLDKAVACVKSRYPEMPVIALWVDDSWSVSEVEPDEGM